MGDIATSLARWAVTARAGDFPDIARRRAVDAITDCIGCMLAGSREPLAGRLLRSIGSTGFDAAKAVLVGTPLCSTPADAALYNGTVAHALDYDDTNHPAYAHPSAVIVPALLAGATLAEPTGADLVTAYILGFEVMGKLGRALNTEHYARGWHATSTFGTLAATVAASRVLGLDEARFVMALGIAASAASGLRANFGTMVKPLHAGYAARNGVVAALLAREGFVSSADAMEHRFGYVNVFNHKAEPDLAVLRSWGEPLEIMTEYGIALKPYPSCGATHTGIEAALRLHGQLRGRSIRRIRAGVSEMAFNPLIHVMPDSGLAGKFSLHFCIAAALTDGVVNLRTFSDERTRDPAIRALIERTVMEADDRVRHDPEFATVVGIETGDGAKLEELVPLAIGKPERWFSREQLHGKFADCAIAAFPQARIDPLFEALQGLDSTAGAGSVLPQLRAA